MMGIIVLIAIAAAVYFYKSSEMADPPYIKALYAGRNSEQRKVIRYFTVDGCLSKTISDQEYDSLVSSFVSAQNIRQKALVKIGLDESELKEIDPVHFEGWAFGKIPSFAKKGKDGKWRSSTYQVSWLFFSSSQVYVYQNTMHFDKDDKKVATEEYFYRDITNFSTVTETEETNYWDQEKKTRSRENIDSNRFALTVPGDKFFCSLEQSDYSERAIQGMKAKLREKKA